MPSQVYALARLLAILVAIAGAFTTVPYAGVILLVLGGVASFAVEPADRTRLYLVALVLTLASTTLEAIPGVGAQLAAIFGGLGVAYVGASIVAITVGLAMTFKGVFSKPAA